MRYDRAFPVAVPEPQITRFCAPRRMNAKVPGAAHSGGSACGYHELRTLLVA
jgi:hypothetical protein